MLVRRETKREKRVQKHSSSTIVCGKTNGILLLPIIAYKFDSTYENGMISEAVCDSMSICDMFLQTLASRDKNVLGIPLWY